MLDAAVAGWVVGASHPGVDLVGCNRVVKLSCCLISEAVIAIIIGGDHLVLDSCRVYADCLLNGAAGKHLQLAIVNMLERSHEA